MPFGQFEQPNLGIYGGGGQASNPNPFGTLGQMMQIKEQQSLMQERQLQAQKLAEQQADEQAMHTTLQQYAKPDDAVNALYRQGQVRAAGQLSKQLSDQRKADAMSYQERLKTEDGAITQVAQILQGADATTYPTARRAALALATPVFGPAAADYLPANYDKKAVDSVIAWGTKRSEKIAMDKDAVDSWQKAADLGLTSNPYGYTDPKTGQFVPGPLTLQPGMKVGPEWSKKALEAQNAWKDTARYYLSNVGSQDEWNNRLVHLHAMGMPDEMMDQLPDYDPKNVKAVNQALLDMTLTGKESADVAEAKKRTAIEQQNEGINAARLQLERDKWNFESGAAPGKPLNPYQQSLVNQKAYEENQKIQSWLDNQDNDKGAGRVANSQIDANGYRYVLKDPNQPDVPDTRAADGTVIPGNRDYSYWAQIPKESQQKYVRDRLGIENNRRVRLGWGTFDEAVNAAKSRGDRAAYDVLAAKYNAATDNLQKLENVMPFTGPARASSAPAAAPKMPDAKTKAKIDALAAEYDRTTDPARRNFIRNQIRALRSGG